ncbi:MAG: bifunctional UDP-N-acetylglucosamine diphosphorylase/glucosamine-1-phosphate N-acetyltransferase GlmU, partial [Armatimonadota bacterium]|nr:bifunctional UDP-N-acetylglucosamine diphosphorylase/glucosamine-1-phosphate N-acetyltransferase GlmU [Armatimonadota bacterium]
VIHPFTILSGVTDIGEDCEIGPGARISDSKIGRGVSVRDSYVVASEVGDGTRIGPYANLRPGNMVGSNVKIGNFVELKKTTVGDKVSAGHLTYLGDAEVGAGTNIGAGTITCNYDGTNKHKTVIGSQAFVGTHSTLVAPVSVGDGAFTAAGSTITEDVPPDALALGRARQINKEGWVRARTEKKTDAGPPGA